MKHLLSSLTLCAVTILAFGQNNVNFRVDLSDFSGAYGNVNLNGSFNDWCGACAVMDDSDNDGVYELNVPLANGTYEYKFTLDGWAQQESFSDGDPCTTTIDGFVNRTLTVDGDEVLDVVCYNSCSACDGTGGGGTILQPGNVTFQVDMSQYTGAFGTVNLNGTFNNWCGVCAEMTDDDGDDIYELTVEALPAGNAEYKFTLDGWATAEQFSSGDDCLLVTGDFINRVWSVNGDATIPVVCWNSCEACAAAPTPGCTEEGACNYDADATEDDGSCEYESCAGCTDGLACNYDEAALIDNGSCEYGAQLEFGFAVVDALCHDGEGSFALDSATVAIGDTTGIIFSIDTLAVGADTLTLAPGSYTLIGTDAEGCSSDTMFVVSAPDTLEVTVNVTMEATPGMADGQADATVTGGTPGYELVWNNMTGMSVDPDSLAGGLYTVVATDSLGCSATASFTMTVSEVDGIGEVAVLEGALFPVPVGDELKVRLASPLDGDAQVEVRDAQGRLIARTQMRQFDQNLTLDATSWTSGIYTLQLNTAEAAASWKFVK